MVSEPPADASISASAAASASASAEGEEDNRSVGDDDDEDDDDDDATTRPPLPAWVWSPWLVSSLPPSVVSSSITAGTKRLCLGAEEADCASDELSPLAAE